MTFGQVIAEARKKASLNQRELANLIRKEDGGPISQPYLNDIEHDIRNPPSDALNRAICSRPQGSIRYSLLLGRKAPSELAPPSSKRRDNCRRFQCLS
jgi:transcriptional regulator with XRE-family HTH domain